MPIVDEQNLEYQDFELYRAIYDREADFYHYRQDRQGFFFEDHDEVVRARLRVDDQLNSDFSLRSADNKTELLIDGYDGHAHALDLEKDIYRWWLDPFGFFFEDQYETVRAQLRVSDEHSDFYLRNLPNSYQVGFDAADAHMHALDVQGDFYRWWLDPFGFFFEDSNDKVRARLLLTEDGYDSDSYFEIISESGMYSLIMDAQEEAEGRNGGRYQIKEDTHLRAELASDYSDTGGGYSLKLYDDEMQRQVALSQIGGGGGRLLLGGAGMGDANAGLNAAPAYSMLSLTGGAGQGAVIVSTGQVPDAEAAMFISISIPQSFDPDTGSPTSWASYYVLGWYDGSS